MSRSISPDPGQAVVARLRAAGCVFAEEEASVLLASAESSAELDAMVDLRMAGVPVEHVVGWAEFCGIRVVVEPGVFVPRHRTELLVQHAVALAGHDRAAAVERRPRRTVVVDLCCGTGSVGLAVVAGLEDFELYAVDVDPVAVRCARRNLNAVGGQVYQGDLFEPLPTGLRGRVDLMVASAPYVPTDAIRLLPPEARVHEPRQALDGGPDGLTTTRRVIAAAGWWLASGGHLLVETGAGQAPEAVRAMERAGLASRVVQSEQLDATVIIGTSASRAATAARGPHPPYSG